MNELKNGIGMLETSLTSEPPFWETYEQISIDNYPIFALGKEITKEDGIEAIKKYLTSRLWFTYRRNFSPIGGTGPSSDQGWGCMLRCAQMLLGEVLLRRHIERHFEWDIEKTSEVYERILQMFFDEKDAVYSIHQIAQMGVAEGKEVSEWFGPNTAAQVIKKLALFDDWSNVAVHVALDNLLIKEDALTMATTFPSENAVKLIMENGHIDKSLSSVRSSSASGEWRPLLIMVPLRLGLTNINQSYLPAIQDFFKLPQCVGIIGGRPNHALYFVGISGTKLFYLDPHYCRPKTEKTAKVYGERDPSPPSSDAEPAVTPQNDDAFSHLEELEPLPSQTSDVYTKMDDSTYHCQMLLWMEYENVDPSLALAFFCETPKDLDDLCESLQTTTLKACKPPLFEYIDKRPKFLPKFEPYTGVKLKIEMKEFDDIGAANVKIDDDFEVLDLSVDRDEEEAEEAEIALKDV